MLITQSSGLNSKFATEHFARNSCWWPTSLFANLARSVDRDKSLNRFKEADFAVQLSTCDQGLTQIWEPHLHLASRLSGHWQRCDTLCDDICPGCHELLSSVGATENTHYQSTACISALFHITGRVANLAYALDISDAQPLHQPVDHVWIRAAFGDII